MRVIGFNVSTVFFVLCDQISPHLPYTGVLISSMPDQEGNKLRSMSGTLKITTSRCELSSSFFPAKQGTKGTSRHSDSNISLFPSWSGKGLISIPVYTNSQVDKLIYTGCPRRNVPVFGRVFLMLKYTDITLNTYVQS